jgi:predicted DNA-binding transcriptional regulator AlpA
MTARRQPASLILALSRADLATAIGVSESTVDEMVKRGVLPKPMRLSEGCVRWSVDAVRDALASLEGRSENTPAIDPFSAGVRRVTQIAEGRRRVPS